MSLNIPVLFMPFHRRLRNAFLFLGRRSGFVADEDFVLFRVSTRRQRHAPNECASEAREEVSS